MFKKVIYPFIIFLAAILVSAKAADLPYKEGELLIKFAPKTNGIQRTTNERNQILSSFNAGTVKKSARLVPGLSVVKLPANRTVADAVQELQAKSEILYVEPNYKVKLLSTLPNDTRFDELWAMYNTGQTGGTAGADINAPEAWDFITDANVIVAVIDTGVDYTHPDLAANMWINQAEYNGTSSVDDDDNGYVDDIYGYDFGGYTIEDQDSDPMDEDSHGTHVAGTIGAVGNNGVGVTGICWDVEIMALKIFPPYYVSEWEAFASNAIEAIDYAVDNGAKVMNASWYIGDNYSQALKDSIENAGSAGVLFVVAAANNGSNNDSYPAYPASYDCDNIISVMATNHNDEVAYYSNYGPTSVDLGAPGGETYYSYDEGILSTIPYEGYDFYQGTSMASPHVAGACALVWAINPTLTYTQVKEAILETVDELESLDGLCVSGGRLNLYKAVFSQSPPRVTKTDNIPEGQGVIPYEPLLNNLLEYTIAYDACGVSDTNVYIVDDLPNEVDYYQSVPTGSYDSNTHTVTWQIGTMGPTSSGSYVLKVKVNNTAAPGGTIDNICNLIGDNYTRKAIEKTPVDCYAGNILYVDADANDGGNGLSWQTAYNNIQDALDMSQSCYCYSSIWVAKGTYQPVNDVNVPDYDDYSFELVEGVGLFGHFDGNETSLLDRNFADANNETILEGKIGQSQLDAVDYVVRAEDIEDAILDGFTIRGSYGGAGVYLDSSHTAIVNCKLKSNYNYGIEATNYSFTDIHNCLFLGNSSQNINADTGCWPIVSYCTFDGNDTTSQGINISSYTNLDVEYSIFKDHTADGIYGSDGNLTVTNSTFEGNNYNGIEVSDITTTVTNCSIKNSNDNGIQAGDSDLTLNRIIIDHATSSGIVTSNGCTLDLTDSVIRYNGEYGINLSYNTGTTILNSWIHNNGFSGLYSSNHTVNSLLVRNTTIYDNGTYGIECGEYGADPNILNCIIADNNSNDLYRENGGFNKVNYCLLQNDHSGNGNRTGDPCFMNIDIDADDLHIDETSPCKDAGDPNGDYGNETDIDGEDRIKYARVDIGADEYYWSSADIDEDGFVNFIDYATFAAAWLTQAGDGAYNEDCDLEDNNSIDFNDLALFCEDWLWQAAWPDKKMLLSTDFESGIPYGWTVVDGCDDNKTWMTNNPKGRSSPYWTGKFCIVDSDWAGYVDMNESLITPAIDCSGAIEVTLEFSHYFKYFSSEKCDVDIRINNGPWQTILQYAGTNTGGNITEDISALAADQPNVRIRWHYYDANYDYYWGIDNVKVIGNYRISAIQMAMEGDGGSGFGGYGFGGYGFDGSESGELMILSAAESLRTRPERLAAKSQKFYDVTPATTISAKRKALKPQPQSEPEPQPQLTEKDVQELIEWLEELWLTDEQTRSTNTEAEWLEYIEAVREAPIG